MTIDESQEATGTTNPPRWLSITRVGECALLSRLRQYGMPDCEGRTAHVTAIHDDGLFDVEFDI